MQFNNKRKLPPLDYEGHTQESNDDQSTFSRKQPVSKNTEFDISRKSIHPINDSPRPNFDDAKNDGQVDKRVQNVIDRKRTLEMRYGISRQNIDEIQDDIARELIEAEKKRAAQIKKADEMSKYAMIEKERLIEEAERREYDRLIQAKKLKESSNLYVDELRAQASHKIREIEEKKLELEERRVSQLLELEQELKIAQEAANDYRERNTRYKQNLELLQRLNDEQLSILANENNISLPSYYTRMERIQALRNIDVAQSKGLRIIREFEEQKARLIEDAKRQQELNEEVNRKRLWALKEGERISRQFDQEINDLEKRREQIENRDLSPMTVSKMSEDDLIDLLEDIKRTIEIRRIKKS